MSFRGVGFAVAASLVGHAAMLAQPSNGGGRAQKALRQRAANFESMAQPPVPNDPLELVSGDAQPVQDAEQRAAAVHLLTNAEALSNVRGHPYDLKTAFVSYGASEGTWNLEDTSPAHEVYRWTAQGPSYSAINLRSNQLVYTNQPSGAIPLRLVQARTAIFFMYPPAGPRASLGTAAATLNGAPVTCVLVKNMAQAKPAAGGRRWDEAEYCVDPKSGLLMIYSPVPGMYVAYDYTNAFHFRDKVIPGKFTVTQAGQTVIEASTQSVLDPAKLDPALFQPAGLEKIGAGPLMTPPWRVLTTSAATGVNLNGTRHMVVLDGLLTPDGQLTGLQVVASSNAGLNQAALDEAAKFKNWESQDDLQPGAAPQSHEVFFTVEFGGTGQ